MTILQGDINRFLEAQEDEYDKALEEIQNGRKEGCWMWYIFPQLKGLGESYMSNYYGIVSLEEAEEYLDNDILRERLEEISLALLDTNITNIKYIFDYPDDLKLKSCMTLFLEADPDNEIFEEVLETFFDGEKCEKTIELLNDE